jgi:pilus assembly protein Flp/PilA
LRAFLTRFRDDQSGATAIEYGLILATVFLIILASVQLFAQRATDKFNDASAAIVSAGG